MKNTKAEVDPKFVIETLLEENRTINENRLYLLTLLRQLKAEYEEASDLWAAEKESLIKKAE